MADQENPHSNFFSGQPLDKKVVVGNPGKNQLLLPGETPQLFQSVNSEYTTADIEKLKSEHGYKSEMGKPSSK